MISRLFEQGTQASLSKSEKRKFVPFVNERNFMGALLPMTQEVNQERVNQLLNTKNMALIENLRKSTKEYFFDKKYQKMARRVRLIEQSMHRKEPDYDEEVARCFQSLNFSKTFSPNTKDQRYYVDLKQSLNSRITCIKDSLIAKIHSHQQDSKLKDTNLQTLFEEQELRATKFSKARKEGEERKIRREVFRQVGKNSQYMADFSNQGLKYKHIVQTKKINPWKKWYVREKIQIFPGEEIAIRKLQKTIY